MGGGRTTPLPLSRGSASSPGGERKRLGLVSWSPCLRPRVLAFAGAEVLGRVRGSWRRRLEWPRDSPTLSTRFVLAFGSGSRCTSGRLECGAATSAAVKLEEPNQRGQEVSAGSLSTRMVSTP